MYVYIYIYISYISYVSYVPCISYISVGPPLNNLRGSLVWAIVGDQVWGPQDDQLNYGFQLKPI